MSNLFRKPKAPPPPDPSIAENARKREERAERETVDTRRRMAARGAARRGARAMLMSGDIGAGLSEARQTLGTTLWAGRNPRG